MDRRRKSPIMDLDVEDDDDRFFDPSDRLSCAVPLDFVSASEDDDGDFDDARISFSSAVSSVPAFRNRASSMRTPPRLSVSTSDSFADYGIWMGSPDSISERRKRLLLGMGLDENMEFLKLQSTKLGHGVSRRFEKGNNQYRVPISPERTTLDHGGGGGGGKGDDRGIIIRTTTGSSGSSVLAEQKTEQSSVSVVFVRSRSEGDIASFSMENKRKEEMIGNVSKQRLTRTATEIPVPRGNVITHARAVVKDGKEAEEPEAHDQNVSAPAVNSDVAPFFLIKNLDTGNEFIVNECGENGAWNRLSDLQTGRKLTMEEFEKTVGHSRVVNKLMRRAKFENDEEYSGALDSSPSMSRSLRMSISMSKSKSRRGSFLRNIKGVASGIIRERERDCPAHLHQEVVWEAKPTMSRWVRVKQSGKSYKEFSALHLCQEFQAHEGLIWKIKFNLDGRFLASAGEDKVVHVWEVIERDCMGFSNSNSVSEEGSVMIASAPLSSEKKKGLFGSKRDKVPEYVHMSETVFTLLEEPYCSFHGHLDEVLDLAWSKSELLLSSSMDKTVRLWDLETKSCLKVFPHNDYVTCIQFNPIDEDYFISGCLDGKVRIWDIQERHVVDWTDIHEMVTAIAYTPDGQGVLVGTMKGSCRTYSVADCKLSQTGTVEIRRKKKSHLRKVTGFQFAPGNPSQVLVTSADARARIVEGSEVVQKFKGFKNADSQIAASFSANGKFIISASDDSQVFIWKNEEQKSGGTGKGRNIVVTRAHENFQCKDVLIAVAWPCMIRGDPPPVKLQTSKRISKRFSVSSSNNVVDDTTNARRFLLPPLPKKKNKQAAVDSASNSSVEDHAALSHSDSRRMLRHFSKKTNGHHVTHEEDDNPEAISRSNSGIGDSFSSSSSSSSARYGFSSASFGSSSFSEGSHDSSLIYPSAWGSVIVTAGIGGEIRCYQNFGLPRKMSRI
ncbi:hypothetical protein HN51_022469 [Arachis hypogaea]|uniref:Uncharacterized protein n=1 Tax=Arachis hypogaea TaxID=3818 RepID=A0A445EC21_ARAHY|nr:WD repeat-containing protein 44 [Arachis hypogaea]QHO53706.1 WD repeat-containing protein [Arachis hypogaea]RYR73074.1 hypothetical protein Ahy_A02g007370 [Arachis hypogaea]